MRICHVITRFIRGGADENTLHSCNGSVVRGHEVHLIVGRGADQEQLKALRPEVKVWHASRLVREIAPASDLLAMFQIARILRQIRPDIAHTHTSKAGILGRFAAAAVGVPIVVHGVHILPFTNVGRGSAVLYRFLERLAALITDAFVSVGQEMRDLCLNAGIGRPSRHYVIPSGMELGKFSWKLRSTENWRDVLGHVSIGTAKPEILLLVSRLEPRKGQHEFLEAFSRIARDFSNAILVLAGEGPDHTRIARRIHELGLNDRVVLTGFRTDIHRLMAIADIGLLTSQREGLPRVLIQYALMRLPTIATDIPGVREVVTPEVTGLVVPTGNWAAMELAIARLLSEPQTRVKFQENQARLNLDSWSVETMNDRLDHLYSQLFNGRTVS